MTELTITAKEVLQELIDNFNKSIEGDLYDSAAQEIAYHLRGDF